MSNQSTAISHFEKYSAAPSDGSFFPTDLDDLRDILAELESAEPTGLGLDGEVSDTIDLLNDTVIPAAERGVEILMAHDEDGYYFARTRGESRTFAQIVPCEEFPCPDSSGIAHCHVSDDVDCGCGATVALGGVVVTEGDDPPFYRAREADGSWTIRCAECGAEHWLVDLDPYRDESWMAVDDDVDRGDRILVGSDGYRYRHV